MHTSKVVLDCQGAHIDPQNAIVGAVNDTTDHETIAAIAGGAAGVSIVPIRTSVPRPTRRRAALATVLRPWERILPARAP
jgi:ADP-ribosylglycohydrolase